MSATRKHGDSMRASSQVLLAKAMTGDDARHTDFLWITGALTLAFALRVSVFAGNGAFSPGCDEPFLQQVAPILRSGNPLRFEVLFYPPVPSFIVATFAGAWQLLGGQGDIAAQCGVIGLLFSLATVGVVGMLGRFWGKQHGLIAMTLYAVTMIAVVIQGNVQVYSTFFVSLALLHALRSETDPSSRRLALTGICLGLGVASKYAPIFFSGILFIPYVLSRWVSTGKVAPPALTSRLQRSGTTLNRAWQVGTLMLMGLAFGILWIGLVEKESVYAVLRRLYEQRAHENPFDYHLPWINRLYQAGLAGVSVVAATSGLTLLLPWIRGIPPWDWARSLCSRHRLWIIPCAALILTLAVAIGLPGILNVHNYARDFVSIAKQVNAGDNGIFPAYRPAVSYIFGYIPENSGLSIFLALLVGLVYLGIKRNKKAALILAVSLPPYVVLELGRLKINRYALDLFPILCLLAALWLGDLCCHRQKLWRLAGRAAVLVILAYSFIYSLAWANFYNPRHNAQSEAGRWLTAAIPQGTPLGVRSTLLVTGSPELLPHASFLKPYRLVEYTEAPDYIILPNLVHAVVVQYLEALDKGYTYTATDWFPSTPSQQDLFVLSRIVRNDGYELVKEFRKRRVLFGLEVNSDSLSGRTWLVEHGAAAGIRIYRRQGNHK